MVRSMYLFVAAVALATAPFVQAAEAVVAERARAAEATAQAEVALPSPTITLKALFAMTETDEVIDTIDGVAVGMGAMEVVLARIDTDGSVITACVDSEKAARAFLDSPIEKVATKKAKEQ